MKTERVEEGLRIWKYILLVSTAQKFQEYLGLNIYKYIRFECIFKILFFQYNGSENFTEPVLTLHIQMRRYQQ